MKTPYMMYLGDWAIVGGVKVQQYLIRNPGGSCEVICFEDEQQAVDHRDGLASLWKQEVPFLAPLDA